MDKCWDNGDLALEEIKLHLALAMTPGVGPATYRRLVDVFGSAEAVFGAAGAELSAACPLLRTESLDGILAGPNLRMVRHQEEACLRMGIRIVSQRSAAYPAPLLSLTHPLPFIFMQGEWRPEDQKAISIVGTRYPSGYGSKMARDLSLGMVEAGFTVVSGLARGIDTLAHEAALSGGGRTVAVLGSGLDWIYPNENIPLARRIAKQGCVISEFPMGTAPHATHFPRRNRLISALGLGTLVVEAGNDSGALITAEFALEQGREIFAVPGAVHNPGARGPHKLIQAGAHLAETPADIIRVLQGMSQAIPSRRVLAGPIRQGLKSEAASAETTVATLSETKTETIDINALLENENGAFEPGLGLDGETKALLSIIGREAMSLDAISEKTRLMPGLRDAPTHRLLTGLLELELKGRVRRLPGALFLRS